METVQGWARSKHYDYRFVGDEIFELVPDWYKTKVGDKLPVATDYARLVLIHSALESGLYDRALWFDADTLILDQSLSIEFSTSCAFGQEVWIQKDASKYRAVKNVHNALCVFKQGCPVLPFLIQTVESIIKRVDPAKIAPQMVGPKLLTALHNIAGFSLLPQIGALSPAIIADIVAGGGRALDLLKLKSTEPVQAVNLCASLIVEAHAELVIENLLSEKSLLTS
jgi:hypothetical protein